MFCPVSPVCQGGICFSFSALPGLSASIHKTCIGKQLEKTYSPETTPRELR